MILRLFLSLIFGAIIGFEREYRSKAAGFRTITIISLGSTLFTICSFKLGGHANPDRIASNIITGMGFIGAGVIFKEGVSISGLTTAATIWIAAAIGMTLGIGEYPIACTTLVLALIVLDKERQINKVEEAKRDATLSAQIDKQKLVKQVSIIGIFLFAIIAGLAVFALNQKRKDSSLIAAEKQRTDTLLLNILPEEIVVELKKVDYKVNGRASVLFADMKAVPGKTEEQSSGKRMQAELENYYRAFDNITAHHKIEKIKTVGDAYLCVSCSSAADAESALNVVSAAIQIRQFVEQEQQKRSANGELYFDISIGIHTGPVIAGIIGIRKFSYDVWGDTVTIAARMEQHGEEGKINISGGTYQLVKDSFNCVFRGEVETKKKEKIEMYFVEGPKA